MRKEMVLSERNESKDNFFDMSYKSAKYIKYFHSYNLVHSETYPSRSEAMKREWQLKKWTRAKKETLVAGNL